MDVAKKKKKPNTVSEKTFKTWGNHEDFDLDVDEDINVTKLCCKVCTVHINVIRQDAKTRGLRGNVLNGVLNFVDGIDGAHKSNILRHTRADGLHNCAKSKYTGGGASSSTLTWQHLSNVRKTNYRSRMQLWGTLLSRKIITDCFSQCCTLPWLKNCCLTFRI